VITYARGHDQVVITLTGGSDIFRFAINMLDDQTEFCEVGRAILVEQREQVGAKPFDGWARMLLGAERFERLASYFRRDQHCSGCEQPVRAPLIKAQRLPMARVACRDCIKRDLDEWGGS
jgi:hypothetical protein